VEATDGVVTLRPPDVGDPVLLIEGRDDEFFRWIGPGADVPDPVACVWVEGELVGWVDYDLGHEWLKPGEVNVGYYLFAAARGKGYASRAVALFLRHLEQGTEYSVATLSIHPENAKSLALARRLGFVESGQVNGNVFFTRDVSPGPAWPRSCASSPDPKLERAIDAAGGPPIGPPSGLETGS